MVNHFTDLATCHFFNGLDLDLELFSGRNATKANGVAPQTNTVITTGVQPFL